MVVCISVALSLLNMIITVPNFQKSKADPDVIKSIETSLAKLSKKQSDISQTANNLSLLLLYRDELHDPSEPLPSAPTSRQIEDRKTYSLAISYITQPDSPPPVRSEGLNLISTLIASQSPILDIPVILVLMSSLMRDGEDYTNLRVIKIFTLLASNHPKAETTRSSPPGLLNTGTSMGGPVVCLIRKYSSRLGYTLGPPIDVPVFNRI